tara:strand:+ start:308 stop:484 length:177 start_codon:yes stop_codon:yes gene_type:complete
MIIEKLEEIISLLRKQEEDSRKCEDGNASAGRRVRKVFMEVIKELRELRSTVLERSKK